MHSVQKLETLYEQKCDLLLKEPEIRFAGIINPLGHLIAGGMKEGLTPLEDDEDRRKMYMELILRVVTRSEFDNSLGPVKFSASRRKNAVIMSFPFDKMVLMVSTKTDVNIEETATKVLKIWSI